MIPIKIPKDLVEGSECLDCEVPWMTEMSIRKLDELLTERDAVFEFGSGGSTLFFARRCWKVWSVETSKEWAAKVSDAIKEKGLENVVYGVQEVEGDIIETLKKLSTDAVTVLSVDTQGGYNRSLILDTFLKKENPRLRMIILDNYAHEGLFPDHWDKFDCGFHDWTVMTFDNPRWAGSGTKILLKPDYETK